MKYEELTRAERIKLQSDGHDATYAELRADWERRGRPTAEDTTRVTAALSLGRYENLTATDRARLRGQPGGEAQYQELRASWVSRGQPHMPSSFPIPIVTATGPQHKRAEQAPIELSTEEQRYEDSTPDELARMRAESGGEAKYRRLRADWIKRGRPKASPRRPPTGQVQSDAAPASASAVASAPSAAPAASVADRVGAIADEMEALRTKYRGRLADAHGAARIAQVVGIGAQPLSAEEDADQARFFALAKEMASIPVPLPRPRRVPGGDAA